jgi:Spy/CpxP family protein refolding chaperone
MTVVIASLAIVLTMNQMVAAQRGGGRGLGPGGDRGFGPGFGIARMLLVSNDKVQAALNLSDDQRKAITEMEDEVRGKMRERRGQGPANGVRGEMQKQVQDADARLSELLDDAQELRLAGIMAQVNLAVALSDPQVAGQLSLTDEQKTKIEDAQAANRRAMRDVRDELQNSSPEGRVARMDELRTTAENNVLAVLTTEQQATLNDLKGEPVDISMRDLFGGRGGPGRLGGPRN